LNEWGWRCQVASSEKGIFATFLLHNPVFSATCFYLFGRFLKTFSAITAKPSVGGSLPLMLNLLCDDRLPHVPHKKKWKKKKTLVLWMAIFHKNKRQVNNSLLWSSAPENSERTIIYSLGMHVYNCKQLPFWFLCVFWGIFPQQKKNPNPRASCRGSSPILYEYVPMFLWKYLPQERSTEMKMRVVFCERRFPYLFILLRLGNTLGLIMPTLLQEQPPLQHMIQTQIMGFKIPTDVLKNQSSWLWHNLNLDSGGGG
jgi:hypothetical protein